MKRLPKLLFLALLGLGCGPTSFSGDAKYPGGAAACFDACKRDNMKMGAFVYMGEYSTACVCQPRPLGDEKSAGAAPPEGAVGATAAVMTAMRMQAQHEQQQRAQQRR